MCNFKQSKEAHRWQRRAEELYKDGYGDCDKISIKLVKEMQSQGLIIGKDFVVLRGRIQGIQHMCLEMYGSSSKKLNGYRIDFNRSPMKITFKGPYDNR